MGEREQQILNQVPEEMEIDPRSRAALLANTEVVEAVKADVKAAQPKGPVRPPYRDEITDEVLRTG